MEALVTVGDKVYSATPTTPPAVSGTPTFVGAVTNVVRQATTNIATGVVTPASITVDTIGPYPNALPNPPLPYPFPGVVPVVRRFYFSNKRRNSWIKWSSRILYEFYATK